MDRGSGGRPLDLCFIVARSIDVRKPTELRQDCVESAQLEALAGPLRPWQGLRGPGGQQGLTAAKNQEMGWPAPPPQGPSVQESRRRQEA